MYITLRTYATFLIFNISHVPTCHASFDLFGPKEKGSACQTGFPAPKTHAAYKEFLIFIPWLDRIWIGSMSCEIGVLEPELLACICRVFLPFFLSLPL